MEALLKNNPAEAITLVNREGRLDIQLPANVQILAANATDKKQMEEIARHSEMMFSCTDVPYPAWSTFYPAVATALAYALGVTKTRLVFADNLYSYGNVAGMLMYEDLPHKASTKKGMIRASVIKTLLHSEEEFSKRVAIVKAADFIGPHIHKGLFGTDFLEKISTGRRVFLSGKPHLPHTFTYIHDFAAAMVNVGCATDTFGQVWHVPNAPAMGIDRWLHLFEVMTGKKAKVTVLPKSIVRLAGVFDPMIREYFELGYQFEHPYLVDHSKYAARFGERVTCPSVIVKETVQWFNNLKK